MLITHTRAITKQISVNSILEKILKSLKKNDFVDE